MISLEDVKQTTPWSLNGVQGVAGSNPAVPIGKNDAVAASYEKPPREHPGRFWFEVITE